ncbi:MAG: DNA primase, partial [Candidatus Binatia bacterium]
MSARFADDSVAQVRDRTNIVEVISRYVSLKRSGRGHMGLCPFHGEKTPSFSVSGERGFFHCFGCGVSGDVYKFLMQIEGLTFPEALERLAKEAGVDLPRRTREPGADDARERQLRALEVAAEHFRRALWAEKAGQMARAYLHEREIRDPTTQAFGLGWASAQGLVHALEAEHVSMADGEAAGLVARSQRDGGWFDRFRNRLMFPIHDLGGRVVGFGGRLLANVEGQPKYLNSSDSPIFHKGRLLYGLAAAREAIRKRDEAIVVEGYMDVIALAQAGIGAVVAPLGTALTVD